MQNLTCLATIALHCAAQVMVKEGKLPFVFDKEKGLLFGVRPHAAAEGDKEAVKWFTLPAQMIFHVVRRPPIP